MESCLNLCSHSSSRTKAQAHKPGPLHILKAFNKIFSHFPASASPVPPQLGTAIFLIFPQQGTQRGPEHSQPGFPVILRTHP